MIHPIICPQCLQPNEDHRTYCWKCSRSFQSAPRMKDYEHLFALASAWTMEDLKRAYHRQAKTLHPDRNPGNNEAAAKFQFVNRAYEELCTFFTNGKNLSPSEEEALSAPVHDPSIDHLADKLKAHHISRNESTSHNDPYLKVSLIVVLIVVTLFVILEWFVHHQ